MVINYCEKVSHNTGQISYQVDWRSKCSFLHVLEQLHLFFGGTVLNEEGIYSIKWDMAERFWTSYEEYGGKQLWPNLAYYLSII
jgi:hypothetical protein